MTNSIVAGLIGSAIVAIIYGVIFAQREERIRQYLAKRRRGWARKRYLRAFIGAAKGHASAMNTALLAGMVLLIPLGVGIYFWMASDLIEQRMESLRTRIQVVTAEKNGEQRRDKELAQAGLAELLQEFAKIESDCKYMIPIVRVTAGCCVVLSFLGYFVWHPFVVMRRRFAYELDRFALRIQGLASKSELAEIAVAESRIADEQTLKVFVEMARKVAIRHNIPQLVETFDLWCGNSNSH